MVIHFFPFPLYHIILIIIPTINAFHKDYAVNDSVGEGLVQQPSDGRIIGVALYHGILLFYSFHSLILQLFFDVLYLLFQFIALLKMPVVHNTSQWRERTCLT